MAPTDANRELLTALDGVSRDLGDGAIVAQDPGERGAGDISFVAQGLACLDGLGASGDNEHAPGEYVDLTTLPMLTRRAMTPTVSSSGSGSGSNTIRTPRSS